MSISGSSLKVEQTSIKHEDDGEDYATKNTTITSFHSSISSFAFNVKTPQSPQAFQSRYSLRSRAPTQHIVEPPRKRRLEIAPNSQISPSSPIATHEDSKCGDTPRKKQKKVRGYAAPEVYAHLRDLEDILAEGLDVVFCGINPGQKSAEIGHHFGHPTNHFWGCLHESGFTSERLPPQEDHTLPERFSLGLTNLVHRPTAEQNELSLDERTAGVPALLTKVAKYRPRILCFIGLGIAKIVQAELKLSTKGKGVKVEKSKEGLQTYKMTYHDPSDDESVMRPQETLFYALPSTSGRVVKPQRTGKVKLFKDLKTTLYQLKQSELNTNHMHIVSPSPTKEFH